MRVVTIAADSPVPVVLCATGEAAVFQNIRTILNTVTESVPLYRSFGLADNYTGRPIMAAQPLLYTAIREAIEEYSGSVTLREITFQEGNTPGSLIPTVEVEFL